MEEESHMYPNVSTGAPSITPAQRAQLLSTDSESDLTDTFDIDQFANDIESSFRHRVPTNSQIVQAYETLPYSPVKQQVTLTSPGLTNYHLTAINTLPTSSTEKVVSPTQQVFTLDHKNKEKTIELLMVEILYCAKDLSINQQQWPLQNLTGIGITKLPKSQVPGATKDVRSANFINRAPFVDLSGLDPVSIIAAPNTAGTIPCVQWFGEQYIRNGQDVYSLPYEPLHSYSMLDSLYTTEIRDGWFDMLDPIDNPMVLSDPYTKQALNLARSFAMYQTRQWAIVGKSSNVKASDIGSAEKEDPIGTPSGLPKFSKIPYFKKASIANGLLDTIEPRYHARARIASPPSLTGFQKVPYFLTNFSTPEQLNQYLYSGIESAINSVNNLQPIQNNNNLPGDITAAQTILQLTDAVLSAPYGAIYFDKIDHANFNYSYTLQFGENSGLAKVAAFPAKGFRNILQQAQLSNALLRFGNPLLGDMVITQGTRAFPYLQPAVLPIPFGTVIGRILYPLGISFLIPIFTLMLVKDKETKIINGLGSLNGYYISSYVTFYILYLTSMIVFLVTGYATNLDLFTKTEPGLLILLFMLWGKVQVALAFLFSSIFSTSSVATVGVFLLTICGVVTSFIMDGAFQNPDLYPNFLLLWPPFAFYRALGVLNRHATSTVLPAYKFSMVKPGDVVFSSFFIMAAETVVLLLISVYLSQVIKSDFGVKKPWHFPITELIQRIRGEKKRYTIGLEKFDSSKLNHDPAFEDESVIQERIRVYRGEFAADSPMVLKGMCKFYDAPASGKPKKEAVKDVSLSVENSTVFGLLGPNGAGKSSLISILTGVYQPTGGEASLADFNIINEAEFAFRSIGVCPQFDILWNDLTIEDHLYFYGRLKGIPVAFEHDAVTAALDLVQLQKLRTRQVFGLSGGEKRRLSIAIALVSNPKVVFLDEPTTGLDPEVRRTVWDTIARARANRTILLTTHSMEEAEVCCQKVGIMAKGRLRCIGTPTELKARYGCGYKLSIISNNPELADKFILSILPSNAKCLSKIHFSRKYGFVPSADELTTVFDMLVQQSVENHIQSWGVSQTTLDEIFTSVVTEDDAAGQ
ncbi:hypothetical protein HDV02_000441 [Globomyces sp. JEL0801]|nr:hypothetical protein HDV02_000441 [Globomyces sp. JEL0801]